MKGFSDEFSHIVSHYKLDMMAPCNEHPHPRNGLEQTILRQLIADGA